MFKYIACCFIVLIFLHAEPPELLLLKEYKGQNVTGWLMSEKLDGVRAYWDGKKLVSRGGVELHAPAWFTKDFPPFELDGELWSKHGDFQNILSIVRQQTPHAGWHQITYNIFEVPHAKGGLMQRLAVLENYIKQHDLPYLHIIAQRTCKGKKDLKAFLSEVENAGGEGVVIRNPITSYIAKRDKNSLKVKSFYDEECEVIGYKPGQGKYHNMTGSLTCQKRNGVVFEIGSGLSDTLRRNPPAVGTTITYQYKELPQSGKPRFPSFLRVKENF
ncbi:MAG: DNA ligase [Sulfurospirillaceae bacterium]|nr:DNA ligase [Sulfurospirillaceae bacterium]MDD2826328.1 DNA ligase [Sulfurospirillaceae bacterium]